MLLWQSFRGRFSGIVILPCFMLCYFYKVCDTRIKFLSFYQMAWLFPILFPIISIAFVGLVTITACFLGMCTYDFLFVDWRVWCLKATVASGRLQILNLSININPKLGVCLLALFKLSCHAAGKSKACRLRFVLGLWSLFWLSCMYCCVPCCHTLYKRLVLALWSIGSLRSELVFL